MTDFYTTIAHLYDHIFPLLPAQVSFIKSRFDDGSALLEIGSATGNLAVALSDAGFAVNGIDTDETMISMARQRGSAATFLPMDMREIAHRFPPTSVDGVICVGNTLVHLANEDEISDVIRGARALLKAGGRAVFQIINYDRILKQSLEGLPTIDNPTVRFERVYRRNRSDGRIDFETTLTVKSTGEVFKNSVPLYPLRPDAFLALVAQNGFVPATTFGGFDNAPFETDTSIPFIVVTEVP